MNVRDLTIELRPRSSWEAVDLGTALAKRYYRDLFRMGLIGFGPFFLVLSLLCWKLPFLLPLLVWWLKPLADRFYLFYLSRRIFGEEVTVKETWGQWKSLLFKGAIALLTWRRFSPSRSMTLAVSDLENLAGAIRSQRCGVISRVDGGQAVLITFGALFLEMVGMMSLLILGQLLIPQGQGPEWDAMVVWFGQGGTGQTVLTLLFGLGYGFLVLLLEPFYLANGFALYLNSRTSQEAWDIELRFRELAARVNKTRLQAGDVEVSDHSVPNDSTLEEAPQKPRFLFTGSQQSLVIFFSLVLLVGSGPRLLADERNPQAVVEEVLKHEDFTNHVEKYKEWVPSEDSWMERLGEWMESREANGSESSYSTGGGGAGGVFQLVGILALVLLGVILVVLIVNLFKGRSLKEGPQKKGFKRPPPKVVMGMAVTPESLPNDLIAQARHDWSEGRCRTAMSLLYRGALTDFITKEEVVIESSDTESECLAQVETSVSGNLASYFQLLSVQWMKAAYSQEQVEADAFERLCQTWPFERRAR